MRRKKQTEPRKTARPEGPLDFRPTTKEAASSRPASSAKPELRLRFDRPYGAKHIASVVVHCAMDYDAAVRMLTKDWGLSEAQILDNIEKCEAAPLVKQYIAEELAASGLDDTSKEAYVRLIWDWLRKGTEGERLKAATILGKGFVGEKVTVDKPMPLPIEGLTTGVAQMLAPQAGAEPDAPDEDDEDLPVN